MRLCWLLLCLMCRFSLFNEALSEPIAPNFSWETLPVFFHSSNSSGPFSDASIRFIAKHFSIAVLEKFQGPCASSLSPLPSPRCKQEEIIVRELRRIKLANPSICTVLYYNSILDFPQYSVHQRLLDDPTLMLHNRSGAVHKIRCPSPASPCNIFDLGNPTTQELFLEVCLNATKSGFVDGCFLDRAGNFGNIYDMDPQTARRFVEGHVGVFSKLQTMLGQGPVIANVGIVDFKISPHADFYMIEVFQATQRCIQQLLEASKKGAGVVAHSHAHPGENELAAFLIGAGKNAFFGFGAWTRAYTDDATLIDDHWVPAFGWPLGQPFAEAVLDGAVWHRRFEHVNVSFDTESNTGKIQGWDFSSGGLGWAKSPLAPGQDMVS